MIVSNVNESYRSILENILDRSKIEIENAALLNPNYYQIKSPTELEVIVHETLQNCSINTEFDHSFQLKSGNKFPDIVSEFFHYGIEVKSSTKRIGWKTTGNSIQENTRVENVERIYCFFIKQIQPLSIQYRLYQDCISGVSVTHSPRYMIDMELSNDRTFFDMLGIDYDTLRQTVDPAKEIMRYFRTHAQPGEYPWWMGEEPPSEGPDSGIIQPIVRIFSNLSSVEQEYYKSYAFARFPEILGTSTNKYNRLASWLVGYKGIVSSHLRDSFSASGKGSITIHDRQFLQVPRIFLNLANCVNQVSQIINELTDEEIIDGWMIEEMPSNGDKLNVWKEKVINFGPRDFSEIGAFLDLLLNV